MAQMETATVAPPPDSSWRDLLQGRNGLRSVALAGGVALHAVNLYIVTTILPSVIADIGGLEYYALNTTLFAVTSIVGSALSAKLIEVLGPRWAYVLALLVFTLGTVCCALAPTMPSLLVGRSIQGFGGGMLFALSYALIRLVFDPPLWSRAMALVSGMWGIATLCGPAVGGVFAQGGHWRWAFWALMPLAALLVLIVLVYIPSKTAAGSGATKVSTRPPLVAISLLVASVLVISLGSLSGSLGWSVAGIAAGLAIALLIARLDTRSSNRLLPTGAYSLSTQMGVLFAVISLLVAGIITDIFVPYFLQIIHGISPLGAGYMTAAMAGGWTLGSIWSAGRSGAGALSMVRAGPVVVLLAMVMLAVMTPQIDWLVTAAGLALYCLALAGVGLGIGLGWPHLLTRVFTSAPAGQENVASASITTVQLYATAVAAALAGVITNSAGLMEPGGVTGAQSAAIWLFACFAVTPALAVVLARRIKA